jgi:serine carboxypeptidase-like clade 2
MHLIDFLFKIQIGNAVINDETDERGMYDYLATHAIISDQDAYQITKYCDFSSNASTQSTECNTASEAISKDIDNIDIYNIYAPSCTSSKLTARPKKVSVSC